MDKTLMFLLGACVILSMCGYSSARECHQYCENIAQSECNFTAPYECDTNFACRKTQWIGTNAIVRYCAPDATDSFEGCYQIPYLGNMVYTCGCYEDDYCNSAWPLLPSLALLATISLGIGLL